MTVAVFEARDRTGGRTLSIEDGGFRYDLGASWVWDHEDAVQGLLRTLGIPTFPAYEEGLDGFEPVNGPTQWGRLPGAGSAARRIEGGTQAIAEALAANADALMTFVALAIRIEDRSDHLGVTFADGRTESARHVVAAYPPPLVAAMVDLEPELGERLRRTPIWMADFAKIVALFDAPFWRSAGRSGRAFSQVGPMVEIHDLTATADGRGAALFGFVPRGMRLRDGADVSGATTETLTAASAAQLQRLFGGPAPRRVVVQTWWREPLTAPTEGGPSPDERLFGHARLRMPLLGGRLHLASTETAAVNPGHIDGAVRRAKEIAQHLRSAD